MACCGLGRVGGSHCLVDLVMEHREFFLAMAFGIKTALEITISRYRAV